MIHNIFQFILFTILTVCASYSRFLFSCDIQHYILEKTWVKHMFLFLFIFFTISYTEKGELKKTYFFHQFLGYTFLTTLALYLLLLLFMRVNVNFLILCFPLLIAHFILYDYIQYIPEEEEQRRANFQWAIRAIQIILFMVLLTGIVFVFWKQWRKHPFFYFFTEKCDLK